MGGLLVFLGERGCGLGVLGFPCDLLGRAQFGEISVELTLAWRDIPTTKATEVTSNCHSVRGTSCGIATPSTSWPPAAPPPLPPNSLTKNVLAVSSGHGGNTRQHKEPQLTVYSSTEKDSAFAVHIRVLPYIISTIPVSCSHHHSQRPMIPAI